MSLWFRLYTDVLDNPKVQTLPDDLFRFWVNLLCVTKKNGGKVPGPEMLSFATRTPPPLVSEYTQKLLARGLLDRQNGSHEFVPHDWKSLQYESDTSTERSRKSRLQRRRNVAATVPEQRTEAEPLHATVAEPEKPLPEIPPVASAPPQAGARSGTKKKADKIPPIVDARAGLPLEAAPAALPAENGDMLGALMEYELGKMMKAHPHPGEIGPARRALQKLIKTSRDPTKLLAEIESQCAAAETWGAESLAEWLEALP